MVDAYTWFLDPNSRTGWWAVIVCGPYRLLMQSQKTVERTAPVPTASKWVRCLDFCSQHDNAEQALDYAGRLTTGMAQDNGLDAYGDPIKFTVTTIEPWKRWSDEIVKAWREQVLP